eukprot:NODE_14806_length_1084_cov_9.321839.p1 GENE.NODE_14806_length_1084_cov_9.321839~~NODE_14806_length_1084_cov_9.321839.p1  ORF type:complete len:248 (-),score=54.93 NODE_14806_length_1084_cov_9.321839:240-983(-)
MPARRALALCATLAVAMAATAAHDDAGGCPGECLCMPCAKDVGECLILCDAGGGATCNSHSRCICGEGYCAASDNASCYSAPFKHDPRCGADHSLETGHVCKCLTTATTTVLPPASSCSHEPVGECVWWCSFHGAAHCVHGQCLCKPGHCADVERKTCVAAPKGASASVAVFLGEQDAETASLWEEELQGEMLATEYFVSAPENLPVDPLAVVAAAAISSALGLLAGFVCRRRRVAIMVSNVPLLHS